MAQIIKIGKMYYSDLRMGGKRIRRALSPFKPKARKMLEGLVDLRKIQRHGGYIQNMSLYTWKQKWLEYRKANVSSETYAKDELALRYLENAFPTIQTLNQITPERLEQFRQHLVKMKKGPYAVSKSVEKIKTMMIQAEKWKMVPLQDWRTVKSRPSRKRLIYYTMDQFRQLISLTMGIWTTAALLMGRAGLRPGEVRHLEWGDINFIDRTIHIRIKEHLNWKPKKSTPDNPHERVVDMPHDLEAHLKSLARPKGFVLGQLIPGYLYRNYFQNLAKRAGIRGFAYVFRHTYASHLVSNGVSLEAVGELLGHSDYRSTKIYAHILPHARRSAVDRLPPFSSNVS